MIASFNQKQLDSFRLELEELQEQLLIELDEGVSETQSVQADLESSCCGQRGCRCRSRRHKLLELQDCQKALERIKQGSFGTCMACGEEIELSRLTASPSISFCIRCETMRRSA